MVLLTNQYNVYRNKLVSIDLRNSSFDYSFGVSDLFRNNGITSIDFTGRYLCLGESDEEFVAKVAERVATIRLQDPGRKIRVIGLDREKSFDEMVQKFIDKKLQENYELYRGIYI